MRCSSDHFASSRINGRTLTGRKKHRVWSPHLSLDPPPLLGDVVVIMISPKKPSSVGSVARALSCFECPNLLLVAPRCDHLSRAARNSSKGAQYLLWRTEIHPSLSEALSSSNAGISIAFTRWVDEDVRLDRVKRSMTDLQESAEFGGLNLAGVRTALVFGREVEGLTADEVKACDFVCSLPIGRLQESLSISHAVSLALAPLFETRLKSFESGLAKGANRVLPASPDQLAFGVEVDSE